MDINSPENMGNSNADVRNRYRGNNQRYVRRVGSHDLNSHQGPEKPSLDKTNYNGRVNILNDNVAPQWPLFQQNNSGAINYKEEALKGIQSESLLSQVFFSKRNIDLLQSQIRYNVWLQSNKTHIIGRQSETELEIIMRSIYLQYSKNLQYNIKGQIEELNSMILEYCIPNILTEVEQYISYKKSVSQLPKPLARPTSLSSAGTKTLELKNFF